MKTLRIIATILLAITIIAEAALMNAWAETRTLRSMVLITIKSPLPQQAETPPGFEQFQNMALAQSMSQRLIKAEKLFTTGTGKPRYTVSERL